MPWLIGQLVKLYEFSKLFPYLKSFLLGFVLTIVCWISIERCKSSDPPNEHPQKTTLVDAEDTITKIETLVESTTRPELDDSILKAEDAVKRAQDDESPFLRLPKDILK